MGVCLGLGFPALKLTLLHQRARALPRDRDADDAPCVVDKTGTLALVAECSFLKLRPRPKFNPVYSASFLRTIWG